MVAEQLFYALNVRSDLTAAAAIRDAALELFAERGFAAVTVRDVAAAAGVSAPLVIHHYKSKEGLRQAVDERAQALLAELFEVAADPALLTADEQSIITVLAAQLDTLPALVAYLRRLLVDGGEPARLLYRQLFEMTKAMLAQLEQAGVVTATDDPDTRAAVLLTNDLGSVILRAQIADVLGYDPVRREGIGRWSRTLLDIYANGFMRVPATGEENR